MAALALCDLAVGIPGYIIYVRPWVEHLVRPFHGGPSLRDVDASTMLYTAPRIPVPAPIGSIAIDPPATRPYSAGVADLGHSDTRFWGNRGSVPTVEEVVTKYPSTDDAADDVNTRPADSRKHDIEEHGADATGPLISPTLPGAPSTSGYYCTDSEPDGCYDWVWQARYGQYGVVLEYEPPSVGRPAPLTRSAFATLVRACAAQIAAQI